MLELLKDPFPADDIEWRIQSSGEKNGKVWARCLAYVTNRAIMNRLDAVVGPANWRNEYAPAPCGGVMCGLSVKIDGEWVTKWDGAENTDIEGVKGGLSGAMKRAAVQWGIGRYLYDLEEGFANVHDNGKHRGATKEKKYFNWDPPALPKWALPADAQQSNGVGRSSPATSVALRKRIRDLTESLIDPATTLSSEQGRIVKRALDAANAVSTPDDRLENAIAALVKVRTDIGLPSSVAEQPELLGV